MCDERGRKIHEREIVSRFHFPPNKQHAKAIVPAVRPARRPSGVLAVHAADERRLPLLSDVRRNPARAHDRVAIAKRIVRRRENRVLRQTRRQAADRHQVPLAQDARRGGDFTAASRRQFRRLRKSTLKSARAWAMKDAFRHLWDIARSRPRAPSSSAGRPGPSDLDSGR